MPARAKPTASDGPIGWWCSCASWRSFRCSRASIIGRIICGINAPFPSGFDSYTTPYQVATVFFAVIDLVAGVGLWLAAPWGAVVWLTSVISMAAVEVLFPQIYGGSMWVVGVGAGAARHCIWGSP